jgi:hypothetical protein
MQRIHHWREHDASRTARHEPIGKSDIGPRVPGLAPGRIGTRTARQRKRQTDALVVSPVSLAGENGAGHSTIRKPAVRVAMAGIQGGSRTVPHCIDEPMTREAVGAPAERSG